MSGLTLDTVAHNISTFGGVTGPGSITNVVGWWDAQVAASLSLSGSNITGWADQSGHGSNLSVLSGSNSPTYNATGLNSKPTAAFSKSGTTGLICNAFPLGTGNTLTFWAVCTFTTNTDANGRIISYTAVGQTHDYNNAASFDCERKGLNAPLQMNHNNVGMGFAADFPTTACRLIGTIDSGGVMRYYVNASLQITSASSTGNWTNLGALCMGVGKLDTQYWDGNISEMGVSTNYSDATMVSAIDTALASKWGF